VISHADADHYNGLPDLFERLAVGRLIVPEGIGGMGNPGIIAVLDEARARGIPVLEASAGDRFELVPGLDAVALHPPSGWLPDAPDNDRSLVLALDLDGRRLLLTGDLDGAGLAELVAGPRLPIDAMLAPHHGGRSSNPAWLYDWAMPRCVVSSQRAPRAGTVDPLASLDESGIAVRRTWAEGAILIRWEGNNHPAPGSPEGWAIADWKTSEQPSGAGGSARASVAAWPTPWGTRWLVAIGGVLLGIWLGLAMAVVTFGAWSLVLPGRGLGQAEPFPEPWRLTSIITGDGLRLRAWRRDADGIGPASIGRFAVVIHGLAEASPSMRGRAEALLQEGWSVLVPDLRSFGRSEGDRCSFGAREAGDVRAWLDALLDDRPGASVIAWGRSMGAAVALRAAIEDDRIGALILEAPYAELRRALAARLARLPIPGAELLAGPVLSRASRIAGVPIDRPRPTELARRASVPVLILRGDRDQIAPMAEIGRLYYAFPRGRRPEVEAISDAGHADIFERGGPELAARISDFLNRAAPPTIPEDRRP
jgi:competence protein ComEC